MNYEHDFPDSLSNLKNHIDDFEELEKNEYLFVRVMAKIVKSYILFIFNHSKAKEGEKSFFLGMANISFHVIALFLGFIKFLMLLSMIIMRILGIIITIVFKTILVVGYTIAIFIRIIKVPIYIITFFIYIISKTIPKNTMGI